MNKGLSTIAGERSKMTKLVRMRYFSTLVLSVLVLLLLVPISSKADNVAYINAGGLDVSYLTALGHNVTALSDSGLTLGSLSGFDAVLVASNSTFSDPTNLGNVLAQFANAGGGVVLTEFDFQGVWQLGGTIMTAGYSPLGIDPLSTGYAITQGLGVVIDPSSPLFTGVNLTTLTSSYSANAPVVGGTLVADWANGSPAVAFQSLSSSTIVDLNLFPGISTGADANLLVSNALFFSESGNPVNSTPEPGTFALMGFGILGIAALKFVKK